MRASVIAGAMALGIMATSACGGSSKKAAPTTTVPSTTTTRGTTTSVGGTTTAAGAAAQYASSDPVAVALSKTLLKATEVQQILKLPRVPGQEQPGPNSTPQGPLNETGVLSVVPGGALIKPLYDQSGGGVGANVTYHLTAEMLDVGVLTVKFATASGGQSFVQRATSLISTLAHGKANPHPELAIGVLPASMQQVVHIPPSAIADPTNETIALDFLYADGVAYLVDTVAPTGSISDQEIIALARAQDAKYQAAKGTIRS
jgi:hypothetical protein